MWWRRERGGGSPSRGSEYEGHIRCVQVGSGSARVGRGEGYRGLEGRHPDGWALIQRGKNSTCFFCFFEIDLAVIQ